MQDYAFGKTHHMTLYCRFFLGFLPKLIINWNLLAKAALYLTNVGSIFNAASSWLVVALTIDRLILIKFPFKAKKLSTPFRTYLIVICIYLGVVGVNGLWFYEFFEVPVIIDDCTGYFKVPKQIPTGNHTFYTPARYRPVYHWFAILSLMLVVYVSPVLVLIISNTMIIKWLRLASTVGPRNEKKRQREKVLAKMTLVVSSIFIVCNILDTVTRMLWVWVPHRIVGNIQVFAHFLVMINVGANFVVYSLMNNTLFDSVREKCACCFRNSMRSQRVHSCTETRIQTDGGSTEVADA